MSRARAGSRLGAVMLLAALALPAWGQRPAQAAPPGPGFEEINQGLDRFADQTLLAARRVEAAEPARPQTPVKVPLATDQPAASAAARVERLRPMLDPILRSEGVPEELAAVVLVESGGQPAALSPKGALGLWQLMPETARRYGLEVSAARDERLDIFKATRAAARYLRDLHGEFRDWELALAAYNYGEQGVERVLARMGGGDFAQIRAALPAETRGYVPAVMAAMRRMRTQISGTERQADAGRVIYVAAGAGE